MIGNNTELAWAAGFFDGEGNTYAQVDQGTLGSRGSINLRVGQSDIRPLERFQKAVERGKVYIAKEATENHKPQWIWIISNYRDVSVVLEYLWPYLSDPKREQAERELERFKSTETFIRNRKPGGQPRTERSRRG